MADTIREQAERLAGPHDKPWCQHRFEDDTHPCDCSRRERVAAIETAIREAEEPWRRFAWLVHGHVGLYGDDGEMQCSVNGAADFKRDPSARLIEHATKALQDVVAEARRQGREEALREIQGECGCHILGRLHPGLVGQEHWGNCPIAIRQRVMALPLDGPGDEGR